MNTVVSYRYRRVRYNGTLGYIATMYVNGVYTGELFGRTRKIARQGFEVTA